MDNKCTNVINSLICNTVPLRYKLFQWHIISTPDCIYHPGFRETSRHFLFECDHHDETRNRLKDIIFSATGSADFTFRNILSNDACVYVLAESILEHLNVCKTFNNNVFIINHMISR